MSKIEETQVKALLNWCTVRIAPSDIHGVGVFALKDMPEGTRIYADIQPEIFKLPYKKVDNNLPEHIRDYLLGMYPSIRKDGPFVYPNVQYLAYMNHSDDANYDVKTDTLTRDVKKGEEITEDYRLIDGWQDVYPFLV